jgi:C4-dicarboxylate-specific signal transduction histidine kinase
MRASRTRPSVSNSLPWLIGGLMAMIFVGDTLTDREIAVEVLYVIVVLLSVRGFGERDVLLVAACSAVLTVLSYLVNERGAHDAGLINSAIGLFAIGATTYLAIKIKRAEAAAIAAQGQLARASRMALLGEMTASIAHEINQPLAAVVTNGGACTRWLAMQPPNFPEARQALARMTRDAHRASEIIARVRSMASPGTATESWLDVNGAIREAVALLRGELSANQVSIEIALADGLPPVRADRVQLQQVLVNLLVNAIEAMHNSAGRREIAIASFAEPREETITVEVRDTGCGIDARNASRIFDPFYTSKPEGMGLGLSISRTIVEAHGGTITAAPGASGGAVFRVTLPTDPRTPDDSDETISAAVEEDA